MTRQYKQIPSFIILLTTCLFLSISCKENTPAPKASIENEVEQAYTPGSLPSWAINANIYEVNVRQYTPEGTFNAFTEHLPRLKKMGVDILWFMPI